MSRADLLAHMKGPATTTCHCWRLARRDGTVTGYADHDSMLEFGGLSYRPESGFSASEARDRIGLGTDTVDVEGALSALDITDEDIAAGRLDGASVETFLVNWMKPSERALIAKAVIGKITRHDGRFTAELLSPTEALDRISGRYIRRACDARLGDDRCRASLTEARFRASGTVLRLEGADAVIVSGLGASAAGWFSHGRLTWTSGANAGQTEAVLDHARRIDGVRLTLWREGTTVSQPGDTFTVEAGCDKSYATCLVKFANGDNFRGFPHLPGNDAAYGYVTEGVSFDGAPIVP